MRIPFTNTHIKVYQKPERKLNELIHPDYKKAIEHAFTIDGVDYYQFKNIGDMPVERWHKMTAMLSEMYMRLDRETLFELVEGIEHNLNKGQLARIGVFVEQIKYRMNMMLETDTLYRFCTCVFFTMDEPLQDYDYDANETKLETFKKQKIDDFFFKEPVRKLIPLTDLSEANIEAFLKETEVLKRYEKELTKLKQEQEPSTSES